MSRISLLVLALLALPTVAAETLSTTKDVTIAVDEVLITSGRIPEVFGFHLPDDWASFLNWSEMHSQLNMGASCDPTKLDKIARRYEAAGRLMKRERTFNAVAVALRKLASTLRRMQTSMESLNEHQAGLAHALQEAGDKHIVRRHLRWLVNRGVNHDATEAARTSYGHPNMYFTVSQSMVNDLLAQRRTDYDRFNETILGTRHVGTSQTTSQLSVMLQPNPSGIAFQLTIDAASQARSNGYNGDVTVVSSSNTNVKAARNVIANSRGFSKSVTVAKASSRSRIHNVSYDRLIGRRRAEEEAHSRRPASDRVAESRARERARDQFDQESSRMLSDAEDRYVRDLVSPLTMRGAFPQRIATHSTSQNAHIVAALADEGQLAANSTPNVHGRGDLVIQVHESLFTNVLESELSAATLQETEWARVAKRVFGQSTDGLQPKDPSKLWTISFAEAAPIGVQLNGPSVRVEIQASSFRVGEETYPGMRIGADYMLAPAGSAIIARRVGKLRLTPISHQPGQRLGMRQQVFKTMVRKRFDPVMPKQIRLAQLPFVERPGSSILLTVESLAGEPEWLTISYRSSQVTVPRLQ